MNRLLDSFSTYTIQAIEANLDPRWILSASAGANSIATPGRIDASCLKLNGGAYYAPLDANASSLYAGAAIKLVSQWDGNVLFGFYDSSAPGSSIGTNQIVLMGVSGATTLQVKRNGTGGTLLGTTPALAANQWHYVEIGITFHATAGTVVVKIDNVTVINLTGQNTIATSNAYANTFYLGGIGLFSHTVYVDDLYVNDGTGSQNNSFSGDIKVAGGFPNGNGSLTAFSSGTSSWTASTATSLGTTILDPNGNLQRCTANTGDTKTGATIPGTWASTLNATTTDNHVTWTCLGSNTAYNLINSSRPDDDYSYLYSANSGDQSTFSFPSVSGAGVLAVRTYARVRKDDAGAKACRLLLKSGSTVGDNGSDIALGTSYQNVSAVFEVDPATSAAFSVSALNASEAGVSVV